MVQGREKTVLEKRTILLQLRKGCSIRKINRELGVHRDVIRPIHRAACLHGWINPNSQMPDNAEIERQTNDKPSQSKHRLDPHVDDITQWRREGFSAIVILRLLKDERKCDCKIGALRRYIKKLCPELPDPVMVRATKPGEVMDVDFGFLGKLWDDSLKKLRKAWVFSGRLRHSRKAFRVLVWEQNTKIFLKCHILAFEYFNGVPEIVCLDREIA